MSWISNLIFAALALALVLGVAQTARFQGSGVCNGKPRSRTAGFLLSLSAALDAFWKNWLHHISRAVAEYSWGRVWKDCQPANQHVVVQSLAHIQQLADHPDLSQRAAYGQIFGFKFTLSNFDNNEERTARTRLFGRVLHEQRCQLSTILPGLQARIDAELPRILARRAQQGSTEITVAPAPALRDLVGSIMCDLLVGPTLAKEPDLKEALLQHPRDMLKFAKAYQVTPELLARPLFKILTGRGRALNIILTRLVPVCEHEPGSWTASETERNQTVLGLMIEASQGSTYWTPHRLVQALVGIWFAASHQPWTIANFVLLELCRCPEYVSRIRQEIGEDASGDAESLESLPFLNSFIKETARLRPSDFLNVRRKAMRPMTFKHGGPSLAAGDIACVSQYSKMINSPRFHNGHLFDGARFAHGSAGDLSAAFTEVSEDFLIWGFGSLACPGRFQASVVVKLVLKNIVSKYDVSLKEPDLPTWWQWKTFRVPFEKNLVVLRPVVKACSGQPSM